MYKKQKAYFFAIIVFGLALFVANVARGASTGTLVLQGVVATVYDIAITPSGTDNTTLNITGGETNKLVASVAETSNALLGYKITASSAGNGFLVNQTDNTKKTAYQMSYNGGTMTTITTAPVTVRTVPLLIGLTTNTSTVRVNVTSYPTAPEGTYRDTVTFTIQAP